MAAVSVLALTPEVRPWRVAGAAGPTASSRRGSVGPEDSGFLALELGVGDEALCVTTVEFAQLAPAAR